MFEIKFLEVSLSTKTCFIKIETNVKHISSGWHDFIHRTACNSYNIKRFVSVELFLSTQKFSNILTFLYIRNINCCNRRMLSSAYVTCWFVNVSYGSDLQVNQFFPWPIAPHFCFVSVLVIMSVHCMHAITLVGYSSIMQRQRQKTEENLILFLLTI